MLVYTESLSAGGMRRANISLRFPTLRIPKRTAWQVVKNRREVAHVHSIFPLKFKIGELGSAKLSPFVSRLGILGLVPSPGPPSINVMSKSWPPGRDVKRKIAPVMCQGV